THRRGTRRSSSRRARATLPRCLRRAPARRRRGLLARAPRAVSPPHPRRRAGRRDRAARLPRDHRRDGDPVRRVAPALTALLVLAGCMRGSIVRQGRVDEDALAAVCTRLETVRGLAFTRRVPARALDREEMRAALEQEIRRSYMPGDFERLQLVYGRLGLLPPGTDLEAGLRRLLDEEAAGFYDPRSKELVLSTYALAAGGLRLRLLSFVTGPDFAGEFFLSHELTHALQDQHYGIDTEPEPLTHAHGDRLLAERALLEGDATLTGFAYVVQEPLSAHTAAVVGPELAQTATQLAARYPDVPEVLRASLAFQYVEGSAFVGDVLAAGGLPALDRAHRDPPAST